MFGCYEGNRGRNKRATKHYIIAAKLGHDRSMETVREIYAQMIRGMTSKEDLAATLRAHQAAVDATISPPRELAGAAMQKRE